MSASVSFPRWKYCKLQKAKQEVSNEGFGMKMKLHLIFFLLYEQVLSPGGSKVWKRYVRPTAKRLLQILEASLGKADALNVSATHVFLVALMIVVLIASERLAKKLVEVKEELKEMKSELKVHHLSIYPAFCLLIQ